MGCCESSKSQENEIILSERTMRESDFYDVSLESSGEFKGFDFSVLHTSKSTCPTSRYEVTFTSSGFLNNISS